MRVIPSNLVGAYGTRAYAGPNRATTRVTIQAVELGIYPVGDQVYSSIVFPAAAEGAMELPNLKSVSWQRSADTEVSTCTLTLFNAAPNLPGDPAPLGDMYDQLGFFTYNRGMTAAAPVWGQAPNQWQDMIVPDRVIRLYQGYGYDYAVAPELDEHVLLMGCYLIDEVTYTAAGEIIVTCRDYGRMLLEQIAFPPVVPMVNYPLAFESWHSDMPVGVVPFADFTDVVRRLLAYGGFYWPPDNTQRLTGDHSVGVPYHQSDDFQLGVGQVYGMTSPAHAPNFDGPDEFAQFKVETFNLKPLMDGIIAVRDTLGYMFFVNEDGAAVFRLPNIFKAGNVVVNGMGGEYAFRTDRVIPILDTEIILSLQSRLSSHNTRERIVVANRAGGLAATADGRPQVPVNFRRLGVWSDQDFERQEDVAVMADMIVLRQLFSYRTNSLRIPANPEIQVDDQVQICERVTGENYLHYVSAISSDWDAATGRWTYDLTTAWLGVDPAAEWAFQTSGLSAETQAFLQAVDQV